MNSEHDSHSGVELDPPNNLPANQETILKLMGLIEMMKDSLQQIQNLPFHNDNGRFGMILRADKIFAITSITLAHLEKQLEGL